MGIQFELLGHQFAWLNNWYSVELAIAYYLLSTVAFIGVLQAAAGYFDRTDLALVPHRQAGFLIGMIIWSGALIAFYVTQYRLIFVPGPATTEALAVLMTAAMTAVVFTRTLVWLFGLIGVSIREQPAPPAQPTQ